MEFVYVVQRRQLFDLHFPHGFLPAAAHEEEVSRYLRRAREHGFFMERRRAERDSEFKQLIPYTVVARGGQVLLLRRSKKGGDARLHDKLSLGVGGHINPPDAEQDDLLAACARREIEEEVAIDGSCDPLPAGIINDDSNPVGSVHVGVVHVARVRGEVRVRETELLEARFVPLDDLRALAADPEVDLESWSRLIVERIDALELNEEP